MLVDVVLYGGERELLLARLDYLQADVTVVIEGDKQFQGQHKGWTFVEQDVWADVKGRDVVYLPIESTRFSDPWANEYHQRNQGMTALRELDLSEGDIVCLFDVDEFPDANLVREPHKLWAWNMAKYQMSFRWFQQVELTGLSGRWGELKSADLADLRRSRGLWPRIDGGFHFSSFLDLDATKRKWEGFSHYELKRPNMDEWVEHCWVEGRAIENGQWLEERDDVPLGVMAETGRPGFWGRKRAS